MAEMTDAYDWRGRTMLDSGGEKIGTIDQVYPDLADGQPEWALVETGFCGTRSLFVPVASARPRGEHVQVDVTKDAVNAAPPIEAGEELSSEHAGILLRHYGEMIRSEDELQLSTVWRPRTEERGARISGRRPHDPGSRSLGIAHLNDRALGESGQLGR